MVATSINSLIRYLKGSSVRLFATRFSVMLTSLFAVGIAFVKPASTAGSAVRVDSGSRGYRKYLCVLTADGRTSCMLII